jgi:uncharacterized protein
MCRMNTVRMSIFLLLSVMVGWSIAATPNQDIEYPKLTAWVNDYVGVLTKEQLQELNAILKQFEKATTAQIFVGILEKLPPGISLEDYALELFNNHWKPGQKGVDNGVLFLVFMQDRKLRISVGYGFETILTDDICKSIITNEIVPSFKQGNYYQGIKNGIHKMITIITNASK